MDFRKSITRRSLIRPAYSVLQDAYPHPLQFYSTPPMYEVSLTELEECCSSRLAVLQTIDEVTTRGLKGNEWRKTILEELKKQDLRDFRKLIANNTFKTTEECYEMRKRDHISHFVLRLAYCETEDKRRWFISREVDLFRLRWQYLQHQDRTEFLKLNDFNFTTMNDSEKPELVKLSFGMIQSSLIYYKVPFGNVSDLVRSRKVFLSKGFAYILNEDMISVIISNYRSSISQSLAYASRRIEYVADDPRIFSLIKGAGKIQRDVDYTDFLNKGPVDIRNLDTLSKLSYPLCMQQLHERLRTEHHLKHHARLQYILFLKGIGVTLDDALRFWKSEFTKKMDNEQFEKQHVYNVRHSFGKEGKKANYSPQSCLKVINSNVGPGEFHGCPFRHHDQNTLKKTLHKNGLSAIDAQEVLDFVRKGHYQVACGVYFQKTHGVDTVIISHPNNYFDESQMVINNKVIKNEEKKNEPRDNKATPSRPLKKVEDVWGNDSGYDFSSIEGTNL